MSKKQAKPSVFKNEDEEANWWASREGRTFVKLQSAGSKTRREKPEGAHLVTQLSRTNSVQIALRLPETDLAEARKIAQSKGIGYQTLLKMLWPADSILCHCAAHGLN